MRLALERRFRVTGALASARLKRERDLTVVGVLKWLLEPISYMAAYFVLVSALLARPGYAYPLFLLCALVPWKFFMGVVNGSMGLVAGHASVLANRDIPRDVLPLVLVATEGANLLIALGLFPPVMAYYGIAPTAALLWLPVVLAILVIVTVGPAYLGAVFGLYWPEYQPLVQNLIRLSFFVSTGLVAARHLAIGRLETLLRFNPLSGIFDSMRSVLLDGRAPRTFDLVYPCAVGLAFIAIGLPVFRHRQREFAKEV